MKAAMALLVLAGMAACSSTPPTSSLGDSPIHEIRCPSFLDKDACLARAERQCDGGQYTVLSGTAGDDSASVGQTVPAEGTIKHRIVTIRCDE